METRQSSKRKAQSSESQPAQGPAKRTRQATAQQAPAPPPPIPPRSTRSQRATKQRTPRSRNTPDTAVQPIGPDQAQQAPAPPAEAPAEPKPSEPAAQDTHPAADPMDRSARRNSRGDVPAGGGDEERDAGDMFGRNFGAAGSALQGLLRKLGANFEDMLPMGMSGVRIKGILSGMKQFDDEGAQLSSLSELCELLSISTEESLSTFPIEQVVPLLVQLLGMEYNPDIMLLAARALTFMADVLPASCSSIVRHGAVPAFCQRLLTIEYIDLAEQSLQALEKLSHEHPQALLQHGGLLAVLSYLDFFPTGVQRTAVATAATMCTGLGPSHVSAVKDALPILCNLLQYQDAKVVDNACMALLHIAEAYAHYAPLLEQLQSAGLINQALQLISINEGGSSASSTQTSVGTYFGMVKLLSTCASGSAAIAQQLLKAGVVDTLRQLLASSAMLSSSGSATGGTVLRTPDQLYEVMTLAHELLPAVPDASDMIMRDLPTHSTAAAGPAAAVAAAAGMSGVAAAAGGNEQADALAEFLKGDPDMVMTICQSLLPLSLQVYSSTVMPTVRSRCLATIVKLLAVGSPSQLETVLADLPISSFVAGLLGGRDIKAQAAAIQMAEILMAKLPQIFAPFFVKEGVAHALDQLAAASPVAAAAATMAAAGAEGGQRSSGAGPSARSELPPPSPPVTRSRRSSKADQAREERKEPSAAPPAAAAAATAADRAGPSSIEGLRTPSMSLKDAVARRAASFKQQHFSAGCPGAATGLESEGLRQLRQLCEQVSKDDTCMSALLEALTSSSVSVFEMISSGAVNRLTAFLQGADLTASKHTDEQLLRRLRNFTAAALAAHDGAPAAGAESLTDAQPTAAGGAAAVASVAASSVPLAALVRKLQAALASAEAFPVLCSRLVPSGGVAGGSGARSLSRSGGMSGSFNNSSLTSGLAALTQPFKLRLVRHSEDNALKEYPPNIVLIEPLANMTAIEDFLWQRVNRGSTLEALRARAAAEVSAAASKPAEGAAAAGAALAAATAAAGGSAPAAAAAPAPVNGATTTRRRSSSGGGAKESAAPAAAAAHGQQLPAAASKAQPIPDADASGGRMTRAQAARARAEAQARAEEAANQRRARRAAARSAAAVGSDGMLDERDGSEEDLLMRDHTSSDHEDEQMHDDGDDMDEDHDMDGAGEEGIFDDDEEDEDMDDGDLDVGSMPVHDLHLAEGVAAAAAAAAAATAAPAGEAGTSKAAADGAAAGSKAAGAPPAEAAGSAAAAAAATGSSDAKAPWARSSGTAVAPTSTAAPPAGPGAGGRTAAAVAGASAGPKLVFYMNGQPLAATCTVFQAIQQSTLGANGETDDENVADDGAAGLGGTGRRGRQLWEQVYTLHYRLAGTEPDAAAAAAASAGPSSRAGSGALPSRQTSLNSRQGGVQPEAAAAAAGQAVQSQWRQSPLGELLTVQLPQNLAAPEPCLDILRLVQLLEVINRLAPRLLASQELQLQPSTPSNATAAPDGGGSSAMNGSQASTAEEEAMGIAAGQAAAGQMALAHVQRDEFINSKLGNKLTQQLKDVLSICGGGIPAWCHQLVVSCKFLFPFEVRRRYFYSTSFGLGRALHHMHQQQAAEGIGSALERDGRELRIGRLQRQKVRVSRRRILDSAVKVMELYAKHRAVLELEYFGEVGTGLGPTLEFYTMLSHELQRKSLGMWRHEEPPEPEQQPEQEAAAEGNAAAVAAAATAGNRSKADAPGSSNAGQQQAAAGAGGGAGAGSRPSSRPASRGGSDAGAAPSVQLHQEVVSHEQAAATAADYVYAPHGLFPCPLPEARRSPQSSVVEHFRLLGRAVAKALQDNRLLDLPLNPVFFRAALGRPLDLYDVVQVDPVLGASLERLARAAAAHIAAGGVGPVMVDGCAVGDLCLTFTLPGDPSYDLCPAGVDVLVDSSNLVPYIQAVVDATLGAGIEAQMTAFREGFNEVFSLSALEVFRDDEMEVLLCGAGEHWTPQQLADSMKFDHGYTAQSTPVRHLLEILSELDPGDQRRFLRFVTGCPRLPPGGIAALQPRLTVVRKHPSLLPTSDGPTPTGHSSMDWSNGTPLADGDLPSVMTCANYIKLPPYSCKEVMRERIMFAIREGQGSFDLS